MQRLILTFALTLTLMLISACGKHESTTSTTEVTDTTTTAATVTSPAGEASPPAPAAVAAADREFVEKAARIGMAEVQLATNVSNRAQTQEVRSYAQQMILAHNQSNQELTTLAAQKGLDPPADLDPEKKALDAELAKLAGPPLDRAYMEAMVKGHAAAATDFETAARSLTDPDLKAWAAKSLPTLHEHHKMAQDILATMK